MPKGTRVHRCVEAKKGDPHVNAWAICQAATGRSYATNKPLRPKLRRRKHGRPPKP